MRSRLRCYSTGNLPGCRHTTVVFAIALLASAGITLAQAPAGPKPEPRAAFIRQMQQELPSKIEVVDGNIKRIVLNGPMLFSNETVDLFCPSTSLIDFRGCCGTEYLDRKGLRKILKSTNLEVLMLQTSMRLDAATLQLVGELENLKILYIVDAELELAGIKYLRDLKSLDVLVLAGTNVDNRSLQMLDGLKLSILDIGNTAVTREGVLNYANEANLKRIHVGESFSLTEADRKLVAPTAVKHESANFLTIKLSKFAEEK